jgi:large subunit ribosomal protein L23
MARRNLTSPAVVLTKPRITEKAAYLTEKENPTYTFEVPAGVNKIQIKKAIKEKYNIDALQVNIVNLPRKNVIVRGKRGVTAGIKKAMVTIKKGGQIDFI